MYLKLHIKVTKCSKFVTIKMKCASRQKFWNDHLKLFTTFKRIVYVFLKGSA